MHARLYSIFGKIVFNIFLKILQTEQVETEVDFYNWDPMRADHESQRNK